VSEVQQVSCSRQLVDWQRNFASHSQSCARKVELTRRGGTQMRPTRAGWCWFAVWCQVWWSQAVNAFVYHDWYTSSSLYTICIASSPWPRTASQLTRRRSPCFFRATILAKIRYCAPATAWSGLCSASDRARLDAFLRRSKKYGYCADVPTTVSDLFVAADQSLFKRVLNNELHVLQPLLPDKTINIVINYARANTTDN